MRQTVKGKLIEHKLYINEHGEDFPEIRNRKWVCGCAATGALNEIK